MCITVIAPKPEYKASGRQLCKPGQARGSWFTRPYSTIMVSAVVEMGHFDPSDLRRKRSISACFRSQSITEVNEGKSPGPGRKEPRRDVVGAHGLFVWITHRQA